MLYLHSEVHDRPKTWMWVSSVVGLLINHTSNSIFKKNPIRRVFPNPVTSKDMLVRVLTLGGVSGRDEGTSETDDPTLNESGECEGKVSGYEYVCCSYGHRIQHKEHVFQVGWMWTVVAVNIGDELVEAVFFFFKGTTH